MKKTVKQICLRAASCVLAGCMLLCPIEGKAAQTGAEKEETVLFEEGFETGNAGMWSSRAGAKLSVVSEHPKSGSYCMKISGRTAPASGAVIKAGQMLQKNQRLAISANARYNEGPEQKRVQITMFCDENYYVLGSSELTRGEWGELTGSIILSDNMNLEDAELFFETPWTPEPSAEQDLMDLYLDDIKATLHPFCDISEYPSLKELYRSQFLVGTAVSEPTLRTSVYSNLLRQQFNSITMENEMKPAYALDEAASKADLEQHQENAALNFNSFKAGLEYAQQYGIAVRGHTLVWHSQTPEWFFYKNYDTSGELADRELMLKRMENYIKEVIAWTETNYPGVIYAWDVVNEAAADPWGENADYLLRQEGSLWYQTIGDDFVQKAFAYARAYTTEYAPDHKIKLFYNDYNEYFSVKRDRIVDILKPVKKAGNIDGMGMQSHFDTTLPLEGDNGYMTAVRTFRDQLGLELHVTELDIGIAEGHTEEDQGAYYQEFMEALLKEKKDGANITCVTFWGLSDGLSWRPNDNCLLLREDLSRKPAFTGVVNAIGKTEEVIGKIAAIGTIELTDACKEKIEAAREAYDALTEAQQELLSEDTLQILTDAEATYKKLEEEQGSQNPEKTDQEKADAVKNLIEGIGTISLVSKEKIEAARTAYNALTEAQKKLVPAESLKSLTDAETAYQKLSEEAKTPPISEKISISKVQISAIPVQIYTGKAVVPFITVTYNGKNLVKDSDYTISCNNNVYIGTAILTVTGAGSYTGTVTRTFAITVKKNKVYSIGNYKYTITNARTNGTGTVALTGIKSASVKKKLTKINIASTVKIGGTKFLVTEIGKNACSGCAKVTSATVGANVTKIGQKAFYNCKKLKKISIKSKKLKSAGKNAIKGISAKATIICPKKQKAKYKKIFLKNWRGCEM